MNRRSIFRSKPIITRQQSPREREVTVCIGALFRWNYGRAGQPPDWGMAAITASDRMITAGDMEYEPTQQKVAFITNRTVILIAGDYSVHSEAIKSAMEFARGRPELKPQDAAAFYGQAIQRIRRRQAEDRILAPLGLNTDSFIAQQKEMSEAFVNVVTAQLQDFQGADVGAIIVGMEADNAHLYSVDAIGTVRCFDDVGFAAIGIGAWHAQSRLMQIGYTNLVNVSPALASVYTAKKAAETAPGVGKATDIHLIFRGGTEPLMPIVMDKLEQMYDLYEKRRRDLEIDAIQKLDEAVREAANPTSTTPDARKEGAGHPESQGDGEAEGSGDPSRSDNPSGTAG